MNLITTEFIEADAKWVERVGSNLESIQNRVDGWELILKIKGKKLKDVCMEQASYIAYYDELAVEANAMANFIDTKLKEVKGKAYMKLKTTSKHDFSDTVLMRLVESDSTYVTVMELYLEAKELTDKCKSIVDAFRQRSYALNNIVKLYENQFEDVLV